MQIILVGDLNAEPKRRFNPKHSNHFFRSLTHWNMFNIGDICFDDANTRLSTFHRPGRTPSRIDHVYCSTELAVQTIGQFSILTYLSDHCILITILDCPQLFAPPSRSLIKKTFYNMEQMTQDKWNDFSNYTDQLFATSPIKDFSADQLNIKANINYYWNILQNIITTAAKKTIHSKQSGNHKKDIRPKLLKNTYRYLKLLQKLKKVTSAILA
jgi:hypothetical protein